MKKNNNSSTIWLRILVIINTLAVAGYLAFSEWEKRQPRLVKHVCQTVAADQDKGLIAFNCLED